LVCFLEENWFDLVEKESIIASMKRTFLYSLGRPFSPLYSWLMSARATCYRRNFFRAASFAVPVLSIGNLTMGGTGKTPMVKYVATFLQKHGYKPAIISRGYGGATKEAVNVVSDGESVLLDAVYVGDEPRMLAESLPGVPVLTGVVRRLPAARAVEMGADVLILDDGFQHLGIQRDLDLVLFNGDSLAGNSRVFPGGDLREPVKALERCHGFVLSNIHEQNKERAVRFADLLQEKFPAKPVFLNGYSVSGIVRLTGDGRRESVHPAELAGKRCFAFCGIARPEGFQNSLEPLKLDLAGFYALADHHAYKKSEVQMIEKKASRASATCLVCTEKDMVKLAGFHFKLPVYALCMDVMPDPDLESFLLEFFPRKTT